MATEKKKQVRISAKSLDAVRKAPRGPKEPSEVDQNDYVNSLSKILSFYNQEFDAKTKKTWVVEYYNEISPKKAAALRGVNQQYFNTFGALVRMKQNGIIFRDDIDDRLEKLFQEISKKPDESPVEASEDDRRRVPPPAKDDRLLGEFEGHFDEVYTTARKSLNISGFTKQFSPTLVSIEALKLLIKRKLDEFTLVLDDRELLSGYGIAKKRCSEVVKFLQEALDDLGVLFQRKPRKIKAVPIQKIVSKVKYLKNDPETGLTSIDPTNVLGKSELLVYNGKTRKLIIYVAEDTKQFGFTGTTLTNVDEKRSKQKTLRHPKDQLVSLLQLSKRGFLKAFDMIRSVETIPTARFSDDTVIIKIL